MSGRLRTAYKRHNVAFFSIATRNAASRFFDGTGRVIVVSTLAANDLRRRFQTLHADLITPRLILRLLTALTRKGWGFKPNRDRWRE